MLTFLSNLDANSRTPTTPLEVTYPNIPLRRYSVMDLCFNRDHVDENELKAELKMGLQLLAAARHNFPLSGKFLGSLSHTLQEHQVL